MKSVRIVNRTREAVLGSRVGLADSWLERVRGFLRRPEPRQGDGLLLSPCRAVHMVGMAYPLDVIFIDRHGQIVAQYSRLKPGRSTAWHGRAKYALELPQGTIAATGTEKGDHVVWLMAEDDSPSNGSAPATTAAGSNDSHHGASADR